MTAVTRVGRLAAAGQAAGCPAAPCPWACAPEACAVDRPVNPDSAGPVDDTIAQDEPDDGWDEICRCAGVCECGDDGGTDPSHAAEWDWADADRSEVVAW